VPPIVSILRINLQAGIADFRAGFEVAQNDLKKFQSQMRRTSRNLSTIGRGLATNVTLPLAGIGIASAKAFAGFDDAMTQSLAIMKNVSGEMRQTMELTAREIGKNTTFSAREAADAYFFLASAGLSASESVSALPQVAVFAQAGMFDLATATDLATDAASALGLGVSDLAMVTDTLVGANTLANASVQQFSESLTEKAGGALKSVGKDIQEGVSVLAAFADAGLKGSAAGVALNGLLVKLPEVANKNADAFKALNIQVFDSDGKMRNLGKIIADFEGSLGGMSDQAKAAAFAKLGLNRQILSSVNLLSGSSDKIAEYESKLRSMGGITEEVAEKQLKSFSSQLKLVAGAISDVGITIGKILAPVLGKIAEMIKAAAEQFAKLPSTMQTVIVAVGALVAGLAPLILGLGTIASIAGGSFVASITAAVVALGAITSALVVAYNESNTFKGIVELVIVAGQTLWPVIKGLAEIFYDLLAPVNLVSKSLEIFRSLTSQLPSFLDNFQKGLVVLISRFRGLANNIKLISLLYFRLTGNTSEANRVIKEYNAQLAKNATANQKTAATILGLTKNQKEQAVVAAKNEKIITSTIPKIKDLTGAFPALGAKGKKGLSDIEKAAKKTADVVDRLSDRYRDLTRSVKEDDLADAIQKAIDVGDKVKFDELQMRLKESIYQGTLEGYEDAIEDGGAKAEEIAKKIANKQAEEGIKANQKQWDDYKRQGKTSIESLGSFFGDIFDSAIGNGTKGFGEILNNFIGDFSGELGGIGDKLSGIFGDISIGGGASGTTTPVEGQLTSGQIFTSGIQGILGTLQSGESGRDLAVALGQDIGSTAGAAIGNVVLPGVGGQIGSKIGETIGKDLAEFGKDQRQTLQAIGLVLGGLPGKLIGDGIATLLSSEDADETARKQLSGYFTSLLQDQGGLTINDGQGGNRQLDNFNFGFFAENGGILDDGRQWVDAFWEDFQGKGADTFSAVGAALNEFLGVEGELGSQLAFALSDNLGSDDLHANLDNIKLFLDGIGVSTEQLTDTLFEMAKAGEISFHEFEVFRQGLEKIPEEGLAAAGDYARAMELVLESGGKGQAALSALQALAVEAGEAGLTSLDGLRMGLLEAGFSAEEVDALFLGFSQRGIKSIEDLSTATEQQLGGIIADMQSAGIQWGEYAQNVSDTADDFRESADSASRATDSVSRFNVELSEIPSRVSTTVQVNYEDEGLQIPTVNGDSTAQVTPFAKGGVFDSATGFSFGNGQLGVLGEAGAEAILPLKRGAGGALGVMASLSGGGNSSNVSYNIDARGAAVGVEGRILNALKSVEDRAASKAVRAIQQSSGRGF